MAKTWVLEWDWEILEQLPAGKYMVITCYKAGKMKQSHIWIIEWDMVKVEVNQYDMKQGRIIYRYNVATKASQDDIAE